MGTLVMAIVGVLLYFVGLVLLDKLESALLFVAFLLFGLPLCFFIGMEVSTSLGLDIGSFSGGRECYQGRFQEHCN